MKQIIVMIAMIALGMAIAVLVVGFGDTAEGLATAAQTELTYENIIAP